MHDSVGGLDVGDEHLCLTVEDDLATHNLDPDDLATEGLDVPAVESDHVLCRCHTARDVVGEDALERLQVLWLEQVGERATECGEGVVRGCEHRERAVRACNCFVESTGFECREQRRETCLGGDRRNVLGHHDGVDDMHDSVGGLDVGDEHLCLTVEDDLATHNLDPDDLATEGLDVPAVESDHVLCRCHTARDVVGEDALERLQVLWLEQVGERATECGEGVVRGCEHRERAVRACNCFVESTGFECREQRRETCLGGDRRNVLRYENGVDHVDDAVRCLDVDDDDFGLVRVGVEDDLAALDRDPDQLSTDRLCIGAVETDDCA